MYSAYVHQVYHTVKTLSSVTVIMLAILMQLSTISVLLSEHLEAFAKTVMRKQNTAFQVHSTGYPA